MVYNLTGDLSTRLKVTHDETTIVKRTDLSSHLVKGMYRKMIVRSFVAYGSLLACALLVLILS